jgi:DNA primase
LDADRSGQEAMVRAAEIAGEHDVDLRVVEMPEGKDPADLLREEKTEEFMSRIDRAVSVLRFTLGRVLRHGDRDTPEGRDELLREAGELIATRAQGPSQRDDGIRQVSNHLGVPESYVIDRLSGTRRTGMSTPDPRAGNRKIRDEATLKAETMFLTSCLASGETGRSYLRRLSAEQFGSQLYWRAAQFLRDAADDPIAALPKDDSDFGRIIFEIADGAAAQGPATEASLHLDFLNLELRGIQREISRADQNKDHTRKSELASREQDVKRRLGMEMGQTA